MADNKIVKKNHEKLCKHIFFSSPSRCMTVLFNGGCEFGYKGWWLCRNCTHNRIGVVKLFSDKMKGV